MDRITALKKGLRILACAANIAVCTLFVQPIQAASVRSLGVMELARGSQLIFHGVAVERRVVQGDRKGQIFTRVTFQVHEVISGPRLDSIDLDFLGGTLNGVTLSVSDMTIPPVGEEGVYFVEQLDHRQANPLYGWWQGHFIVRDSDGGRKIVTTHSLKPIYDLQPQAAATSIQISEGVAAGVITEIAGTTPLTMSIERFKSSLRRLVEIAR